MGIIPHKEDVETREFKKMRKREEEAQKKRKPWERFPKG